MQIPPKRKETVHLETTAASSVRIEMTAYLEPVAVKDSNTGFSLLRPFTMARVFVFQTQRILIC